MFVHACTIFIGVRVAISGPKYLLYFWGVTYAPNESNLLEYKCQCQAHGSKTIDEKKLDAHCALRAVYDDASRSILAFSILEL